MNAAEKDFRGRHWGDGVDGSVQRPVRCVVRITSLSELASIEMFGHSASPKRRLRNFEDYVSGPGAVVLSRRGSECQCHLPESGEKRERRGQMHDHAANRTHHPGTQFQQPFTDCPDLSSGTAGVRGLQT